ncbi:hypothetical protein LINPERHAP1_LOCUS19275 [Linum perenne]
MSFFAWYLALVILWRPHSHLPVTMLWITFSRARHFKRRSIRSLDGAGIIEGIKWDKWELN